MKRAKLATFALALGILAGTAAASSGSLNEFRPNVMPVLVQVNSLGKVISASPSIELSPRISRLLRANLDEMITKPATDKHGRPISSQFIINLALLTSRRDNGTYDAHFAYVSTSEVPAGSWYWVHVDGHRLALANQNSSNRREHLRYYRENHLPTYQRSYQRPPAPPANNASHEAPAPAPANHPEQGR